MNRLLIITIIVLALAGCDSGKTARTDTDQILIRCVNGVEYYLFREFTGNVGYGFMAVRYDAETGEVVRCHGT